MGTIKIGEKEYQLKKFTLGVYPEAMAALQEVSAAGADVAARTKGIVNFLAVTLGVTAEEMVNAPFDDAANAMGAIVKFNQGPKV